MAFWDSTKSNQFIQDRNDLVAKLRLIEYNPNLEADKAELERLSQSLEVVPTWANPILTALLKNSITKLRYDIQRTEEDITKRKGNAIEGCANADVANWAYATDLMDRSSIDAGYTSTEETPSGVGKAVGIGTAMAYGLAGVPSAMAGVMGGQAAATFPAQEQSGYDPSLAQSGMFNIPGRYNEVSSWEMPDSYTFEAAEGTEPTQLKDYIPAQWLNKYMTGNGLRPIGAQEELGGAQLAQLQELQGWSKSGSPQTLEGYLDASGQFGTHWTDYYNKAVSLIPKRQRQIGQARYAVQR